MGSLHCPWSLEALGRRRRLEALMLKVCMTLRMMSGNLIGIITGDRVLHDSSPPGPMSKGPKYSDVEYVEFLYWKLML